MSAARGPSISCPGWWGASGGRRPWGARRRVPARARAWADQGDRAGPVHDGPADAGRALRGATGSSRWPSRPPSTRMLRDLRAAGVIVQIDEPWLQHGPEQALWTLHRGAEGVEGETVLHTCHGYAAVVEAGGLSGRSSPAPPCARSPWRPPTAAAGSRGSCARSARPSCSACSTSATRRWRAPRRSAERIRAALEHVEPERLVLAPTADEIPTRRRRCSARAQGAALVRAELDRR